MPTSGEMTPPILKAKGRKRKEVPNELGRLKGFRGWHSSGEESMGGTRAKRSLLMGRGGVLLHFDYTGKV